MTATATGVKVCPDHRERPRNRRSAVRPKSSDQVSDEALIDASLESTPLHPKNQRKDNKGLARQVRRGNPVTPPGQTFVLRPCHGVPAQGQQTLRIPRQERAGSGWADTANGKQNQRLRRRTCTFQHKKGRSRQVSYRKTVGEDGYP